LIAAAGCLPAERLTQPISLNRIIKYDLSLKCMLVRCGRPVLGSRLIVPVLSFLSEFSVQLTFHRFFFIRKHLTQACSHYLCRLATCNQMSVFSGESHGCRRDLRDASTALSIPKNIYSPV